MKSPSAMVVSTSCQQARILSKHSCSGSGQSIGRMSQAGVVIQNVRMESEVLASTSFWRAVALLRLERPAGLAALESVFAAGRPQTRLRGPMRGRFLASTIGHHIDPAFEALTTIWLPWKGK